MAYAIIRVGKMKSASAVSGQGDHVERLRETPNAEAELLKLNQRLAGTADPWADVQTRFDECQIKPQKNAVLAIDVFITASPEHFKKNHPDDPNWKAFQAKAIEFLKEEYGKENIVHAVAHHDETSPHLHAIITPIRNKTIKVGRQVKKEKTVARLCARDWLGGDRTTLSKLQTRFADKVADLGLKRGIAGSRATHTEVKQFYTVVKEIADKKKDIDTLLAPVNIDKVVMQVDKPGFGMLTPRAYAQQQVRKALSGIQAQINRTNDVTQQSRQDLTVQLQTIAVEAIAAKSQTRESQAEVALRKLGYRLDRYGNPVNIQEERNKALRATIINTSSQCTSWDEMRAHLAGKGLRIGFDKERKTPSQDGNGTVSGFYVQDTEGRVYGEDLDQKCTSASIMQQFRIVRNAREEAETKKKNMIETAELKAEKEKVLASQKDKPRRGPRM